MGDFFQSLAELALGRAPLVMPLATTMFGPAPQVGVEITEPGSQAPVPGDGQAPFDPTASPVALPFDAIAAPGPALFDPPGWQTDVPLVEPESHTPFGAPLSPDIELNRSATSPAPASPVGIDRPLHREAGLPSASATKGATSAVETRAIRRPPGVPCALARGRDCTGGRLHSGASRDERSPGAGKRTAVSDKNADIYSVGFFEYFKRLISAPFVIRNVAVPRYAFAVILIFIIVGAGLLMKNSNAELNPYIATGSEKSVMVQAMKNFHKILTGDIKPEMKSSDKNQVKDFVKNKTNFEAYVPDISDYVLEGAACDEYKGQKLAHIVYKSGREIIYIYETQVNSLHCKELELPEPVHYDILKDKFYMCDKVDANGDCTMIVWYKDNVVCASVSTMTKQRMFSSFTSFK